MVVALKHLAKCYGEKGTQVRVITQQAETEDTWFCRREAIICLCLMSKLPKCPVMWNLVGSKNSTVFVPKIEAVISSECKTMEINVSCKQSTSRDEINCTAFPGKTIISESLESVVVMWSGWENERTQSIKWKTRDFVC